MIISFFENSNNENYFITDKLIYRGKDFEGKGDSYLVEGLYISPNDIRTEIRYIVKNKDSIINGIQIYCDSYTRKRIFKIIENHKRKIEEEVYDYLLKLENND